MEVSVVKSNKGSEKLFIDGFEYHFRSKNNKNEFRWCCAQRKALKCKSIVYTKKTDGEHKFIKTKFEHSHDSAAHKKEICDANNKLKELAQVSSSIRPSRIIRDITVNCNPLCRPYLPSKRAQKEKIGRIRRNTSFVEPQNIDNIDIPNNLKYLEGELFVLSEKRFNGQINIILGTNKTLKTLGESRCWLMDGTFYVVPSILRQLFTIHGKVQDEIVPLIFCLMSSKSLESYNEFFYELCYVAAEKNITLNPQRIISDFEKTISSAARNYFPSAQYKGCLFHFGQNIWRKVQQKGLAKEYGRCEEFSIHIRMLKSLAFVPPSEVILYFNDLNLNYENNNFKNFCRWFKKVYIGDESNDKIGRYPPEFWTVEDTIRENFPRTQNSVEAWHRRLKVVIGRKNIGVYQIIKELAAEVILVQNTIDKIDSGEGIIPNKRKTLHRQKILKIINRRTDMDNLIYLKSIARNIRLY